MFGPRVRRLAAVDRARPIQTFPNRTAGSAAGKVPPATRAPAVAVAVASLHLLDADLDLTLGRSKRTQARCFYATVDRGAAVFVGLVRLLLPRRHAYYVSKA